MVTHNFLRRFSEWAHDLSFDELPEEVLTNARLQVANMLAAGIAGHTCNGETIDERFLDETEHGSISVIGGRKRDPQTALFLNTTYSMIHDYDDYLFMGHTGHSSVFSALLASEMAGLEGPELLTGVVIANELEGRLGASVAMGPHNGQMWSFIHQAGTAAVVATLLDGTVDQIYNAVSMSLYSVPYPGNSGFMSGDAKDLTASSPSVSGLQCALMSLSGAEAGCDTLQGQEGFLERYSYVPLSEMLDGLGTSWVTETLCFKPRPGCAYIQSPLQLLSSILEEESVNPDQVERVDVQASLLSIVMEALSKRHRGPGSLSPTNVTFSVQYSLAMSLLQHGFDPGDINRNTIKTNRDRLDDIAESIRLRHSWNHTLNTIQGMQDGIDFAPLVRKKGYYTILSGFLEMRQRHPSVSLSREVINLFLSGAIEQVGDSISSPLNWHRFDLANAKFDRLRLDFGATVRVEKESGAAFTRSTQRHAGSTGENNEQVESAVFNKLRRESEKYFDSESRVETLVKLIKNLEDRSAKDVTNAFM